MSAIFGIVHLDGRPVDTSTLRAMQSAMHYWGPDGAGLWHAGNAGVGHLMRYNTPTSQYETMPVRGASGHVVLTAAARLDNRDDLCERLGVPRAERASVPDGQLILKAYETWGEECPDYLLGDWTCAVWDTARQRLFLARDHCGNTGLYYYHTPRMFAFAACLKGLLALATLARRPHELYLVQTLTSWPVDGTSTAYQDVLCLPPAHALTVTADQLKVWRYWCLEDAPDVRYASDQAYVEAFLTLYTEAVRCRLRSHRPVGATLSGGLDSGSVCAMAAAILRPAGQRLPVFSSVPLYDPMAWVSSQRYGDETPLIEATRRSLGDIDVNYIRAADVSPLQGLYRVLWWCDAPGHAAANSYWISALLDTARQQGIGTLLTGQTGNATVSWAGHGTMPDLRGLYQARQYRQVLRSLIRMLLPPSWVTWYRYWHAGPDPWQHYSAINGSLARRLDLSRLMRAHGHDPAFLPALDTRTGRYRILRPGRSIVGALWHESGAGTDLEVRDPTGDKRLLEFCLGIPDDQYYRSGKSRWLIRRAMADVLPHAVLWNNRRGLQAADIGQRIVNSAAAMRTVLEHLASSSLACSFLEIPLLYRVLQSVQKRIEPRTTGDCVTILLRGLMVGLFLLRFEAPDVYDALANPSPAGRPSAIPGVLPEQRG